MSIRVLCVDDHPVFRKGITAIVAGEGSFVYGPRDIPHTFTVTSETARFLLVTQPAGFENLIRAFSEPAAEPGILLGHARHPNNPHHPRLAPQIGHQGA